MWGRSNHKKGKLISQTLAWFGVGRWIAVIVGLSCAVKLLSSISLVLLLSYFKFWNSWHKSKQCWGRICYYVRPESQIKYTGSFSMSPVLLQLLQSEFAFQPHWNCCWLSRSLKVFAALQKMRISVKNDWKLQLTVCFTSHSTLQCFQLFPSFEEVFKKAHS